MTVKARDLKPAQWIEHSGHEWLIEKINPHRNGLQIVMNREDLEIKEFRKKAGTWLAGRATVTSILNVEQDMEFRICTNVDERQFD